MVDLRYAETLLAKTLDSRTVSEERSGGGGGGLVPSVVLHDQGSPDKGMGVSV